MAVSVTAQSGTGSLDSVPAWAAWSWSRVTGPAALRNAEPWAHAGALCLCFVTCGSSEPLILGE